MAKWIRYRFHASPVDYRPVLWPPPGPFWCSGYGGVNFDGDDDEEVTCGYSIVVAYVPGEGGVEMLKKYWPEADQIDPMQEEETITYTSRFPKPDWWKEEDAPPQS